MARILIIDDDDIQRRIVREILEAGAHDVTEAEDGNQGLRLQNEQVFDLIITDILMPGMEGVNGGVKLDHQGGVNLDHLGRCEARCFRLSR